MQGWHGLQPQSRGLSVRRVQQVVLQPLPPARTGGWMAAVQATWAVAQPGWGAQGQADEVGAAGARDG